MASGNRIIVTLECTEARKLGASPLSRPTEPTTVQSHVNDDTCRELFV